MKRIRRTRQQIMREILKRCDKQPQKKTWIIFKCNLNERNTPIKDMLKSGLLEKVVIANSTRYKATDLGKRYLYFSLILAEMEKPSFKVLSITNEIRNNEDNYEEDSSYHEKQKIHKTGMHLERKPIVNLL